MNILLTALLTLTLPLSITKEDLRKLLDAGVGDQVIVEYIRSNGPAEPLSVEDVTELKKAGASDSVLRAMLDASRTSDAVTPTAPKGTTTYSDSSSYSYSYPSYSYSYSYAPYYYPYYPSYPFFNYSYYPRSTYYYPYSSYRYYPYHSYNHYPHYYSRPGFTGVSPYRHSHPQTVQPHHGGAGTYRR
jgi:hypothetical protein